MVLAVVVLSIVLTVGQLVDGSASVGSSASIYIAGRKVKAPIEIEARDRAAGGCGLRKLLKERAANRVNYSAHGAWRTDFCRAVRSVFECDRCYNRFFVFGTIFPLRYQHEKG